MAAASWELSSRTGSDSAASEDSPAVEDSLAAADSGAELSTAEDEEFVPDPQAAMDNAIAAAMQRVINFFIVPPIFD